MRRLHTSAPYATELVAVDVGGTHVRFAVARLIDGCEISLGQEVILETRDHAGPQEAWGAFARGVGRPLPRAAAIAVACAVRGDELRLTNRAWTIRPSHLAEQLGLDDCVIVNDFGAVGHAVANLGREHHRHVCGPDLCLPPSGVVTIVGPGTGLGVAYVARGSGGTQVVETEGGHTGFSPLDDFEDELLSSLRVIHGRVSVERVVSGPSLTVIHAQLCRRQRLSAVVRSDRALWADALAGQDLLASEALERFCRLLGSIAGDKALAQGAAAVVIAGGLGAKLADVLPRSGFADRFADKGRLAQHMASIPVHILTHPQPGLFGAAAAFAHRRFAPTVQASSRISD